MDVKKALLGLTLSLLLGSGVVAAADSDKGVTAFNSRDYKSAFAELMPLAKKGDGRSQLFIGLMYDSGWGVLQNDKQAVKWYTLSAENGTSVAQDMLTGDSIVARGKNPVKWVTLAAEQGNVVAQNMLANSYKDGMEGLLKNDKAAFKWFTLAAEQGSSEAQLNLGRIYLSGVGALQNDKLSAAWTTKAAE